jgi:lipopolysaccharide exporter
MIETGELDPAVARRRAVRGVAHLALRTAATHVCILVGTVVLARILEPQEFGVYAVLLFALTFFQLFGDAGLGAALIQSRETPSERALANVFTLQTLLAVAAVAVAWMFAPAIHLLWTKLPANAPSLLRAMSVAFVVTTLRVVPSILLERRLRFGVIAIAEVAQVVVFYVTACACALGDLRAWTWPVALLAQAITGATIVCLAQPWRPRFALDGETLRPLLRFGLPFQLKNFVGFANGAVTPLYAGSVLGPASVGLIGWGQQLAYLPLKLVEIVARVSFPLFSRLQYDRDALARVLERALQLCAAAVFFTTALFLTAGPNITVLVFSGKWLDGLVPLQAFSAALIIGFVSPVVAAVLDAVGRPGVIAKLAVGWTVLNWIVVPIATWKWGMNGFVLGYCVHVVVGNVLLLLLLPRVLPGVRLFRPLLAPALGGIGVATLGWFVLRPWSTTPLRLAIGVALALTAHVAIIAATDPRAIGAARRLLAPGATTGPAA